LGTVSLKARWLREQQRAGEIEPLVEGLSEKLLAKTDRKGKDATKQEAQLCLAIGNIYTAVDLHQAAERWYRRLVKLAPEGYQALAQGLARQNRLTEAIHACEEAGNSDSSSGPAITAAAILVASQPSAEGLRLAEPLLAKALANHNDDPNLLAGLATLRVVQQQGQDAIQLYQKVLQLKPKDVLTMNNLATLLSEQPDKHEEALTYVEKAIQIAGPRAPLLDTKGTILVHDRRPGEAVAYLETAASDSNADPRYQLHLAEAYDQMGEVEKAREAIKKAIDSKVARQVLTPMDETLLGELKRKLNP
jgi:tetratricopeptide (TPR) repeat protein